jgi:hypothetical protein
MRPAAPARLYKGYVCHTDQLAPVNIRPHLGSVSTVSIRTLLQSALELVSENARQCRADVLAHLAWMMLTQ